MASKFMSSEMYLFSCRIVSIFIFLARFLDLVLLYVSVTALVLIPSQYHIHRTRRMLQEGEPFALSHYGRSQPAVPPRSAGK